MLAAAAREEVQALPGVFPGPAPGWVQQASGRGEHPAPPDLYTLQPGCCSCSFCFDFFSCKAEVFYFLMEYIQAW